MEGTKEFIKAKSKAVTSATKASRQTLNAETSTKDGQKLPTEERAEKIRDLLARLKDVTHQWSILTGEAMPKPLISTRHIIFAFPTVGHVIQNSVTSDGKQNFTVDDVTVIQESETK